MDQGPPDSKRMRFWEPSGATRPHPNTQPLPPSSHHPLPPPSHAPHASSTQLPPPPPPQGPNHHYHHHSASASPYQYPPRASELPLPAPTPVSLHGHAQQHPEIDRRHSDQETLAPMQDPYRQPPPPPQQQQQQQPQHHPGLQHPGSQHPISPAHAPYQYPSRDTIVKREPGDDLRRPNSTGHAPDAHPPAPQVVPTPHSLPPQLPPPQQHPQSHPQHQQPPQPQQYPPQHLQQHPQQHPQQQQQQQPPTPQQQHPPPPPPAFQDNPPPPRHMNYENQPSMPPTPGAYRAPSFPPGPPTPIPQQQPYEQNPNFQPQEPFYSVYSTAAKKKNTRASQACDQCRQLKAKCDELKPCKTCRDKGTECRYRDPVPKATDKAQTDILEGINSMQSTLQFMSERFGTIDDRLTKIESAFSRLPQFFEEFTPRAIPKKEIEAAPLSHPSPPPPPPPPQPLKELPISRSPVADISRDQPVMSTETVPTEVMSSDAVAMAFGTEDEIEAEPGPPVPPGEPAIPINHTTLAGLLLDWDPIKELTRHHLEREGIKYVSEYPISLEQSRGILKVYGRGEDSHQRLSREATADHGNAEIGDDNLSDIVASSPAADWGQLGGGLSPGDQIEYRGGVLGPDGNPDFSEHKVAAYVESFKNNILNMHPIIHPQVLDEWVHQFINELPTANPKVKAQPLKSTFAVSQPLEITGAKRKRSPDPDVPVTPSSQRLGKPSRSIHSALILIVLALGKICMYQDEVPDVIFPVDPIPHGSPVSRNGVPPSPIQGSPPAFSNLSHSSGFPSPRDQERGYQSRRSSIHGASSASGTAAVRAGYSLKKNYEVIPGLEYFALATDILGNHLGAYNNMKNVYANIFAGLYHGQLARPLESFAFIHKASHKLQVLMRPSLDKLKKIKTNMEFIQEGKYNQLALAFWTCLQLESDLIAELPLPPSGLLQYENDMPQPNMSLLQGFDQRVVDSYPAQLYLRTHLNSIHRMFYSPDDSSKPEKLKNVRLVADGVSGMSWVPPSFRFNETDPPANDILSARLRAKYWGAQMITYRPFVRQILQWSYELKRHPQSPHAGVLSEYRYGVIAPFIPPNVKKPSDLDRSLIELARKGIYALIESTRSFHGLGEKRPIITNVFGTAHAQWGNLLVLAAAFKDPVLHEFVPKELLRELFQKTIAFLRQSATHTSSLRIDMHILEGLQRDLFHSDVRMASSFSSNTGHHTPKLPMAAPPLGGDASIQPPLPPPPHQSPHHQQSPHQQQLQPPRAQQSPLAHMPHLGMS